MLYTSEMNRKNIVATVTEKKKHLKKSTAFTISPDVLNKFRVACRKEKVSASAVVEEMMKEFLKNK